MTKSKWWVGQRVHACGWGEGMVIGVNLPHSYSVIVQFQSRRELFTEDGKFTHSHTSPTLFPIDTERPKEKAKRRVEGWANFYQWNIKDVVAWGLHDSQAEADKFAIDAYRLGPACHIIHEWEEEA